MRKIQSILLASLLAITALGGVGTAQLDNTTGFLAEVVSDCVGALQAQEPTGRCSPDEMENNIDAFSTGLEADVTDLIENGPELPAECEPEREFSALDCQAALLALVCGELDPEGETLLCGGEPPVGEEDIPSDSNPGDAPTHDFSACQPGVLPADPPNSSTPEPAACAGAITNYLGDLFAFLEGGEEPVLELVFGLPTTQRTSTVALVNGELRNTTDGVNYTLVAAYESGAEGTGESAYAADASTGGAVVAGDSGAAKGVQLYARSNEAADVTFNVTVSGDDDSETFVLVTITYSDNPAEFEVNVNDVLTVLEAGSFSNDYGLADGFFNDTTGFAGQARSETIAASDGNTAADIQADTFVANITGPLGSVKPLTVTPGTAAGNDQDFVVTYTFPATLESGTYDYRYQINDDDGADGDAVRFVSGLISFDVENVAPTLAGTAAEETIGAGATGEFTVSGFTASDVNFGDISGAATTEIVGLSLGFFALNCDGDEVSAGFEASDVDLSARTSSNGDLTLDPIAYEVVAGAAPGTYALCGTVEDEGGLTSDSVLLATISITALNDGFHLTFQANDGLQVSGDPESTVDLPAFALVVTGTDTLNALSVTIPDFTRGGGESFSAEDAELVLKLCTTLVDGLCDAADLGSFDFDGSGVNTATFNGLNQATGAVVFVQATLTIPNTLPGSYTSALDVTGSA